MELLALLPVLLLSVQLNRPALFNFSCFNRPIVPDSHTRFVTRSLLIVQFIVLIGFIPSQSRSQVLTAQPGPLDAPFGQFLAQADAFDEEDEDDEDDYDAPDVIPRWRSSAPQPNINRRRSEMSRSSPSLREHSRVWSTRSPRRMHRVNKRHAAATQRSGVHQHRVHRYDHKQRKYSSGKRHWVTGSAARAHHRAGMSRHRSSAAKGYRSHKGRAVVHHQSARGRTRLHHSTSRPSPHLHHGRRSSRHISRSRHSPHQRAVSGRPKQAHRRHARSRSHAVAPPRRYRATTPRARKQGSRLARVRSHPSGPEIRHRALTGQVAIARRPRAMKTGKPPAGKSRHRASRGYR